MVTDKSYDQSRRVSPKRTFILTPENDKWLGEFFTLNKKKVVSHSGALNTALDILRKGN